MKRILLLITIVLVFFSCIGRSPKKVQEAQEVKQTDCVEVLYFHGKQRCITCNAIEKFTKEVVDSLSSDKVIMKIIDISQAENEAIADKYEVTWSSLILNGNGKVEDLTEMAFGCAKNQPGEFKQKLVESITKILN